MKSLVIVDTYDKESLKKLDSIQDEIIVLTGFRLGNDIHLIDESLSLKSVQINKVLLEDYDKKIFIKSKNQEFNDTVVKLLQSFPDNKYKYLPSAWRREKKIVDETLEDVKVIVQKAKKTDIQRFILEFHTDEPLRFLDRSKVKLYIQRAFIRINVDARKKKMLFTDQFRFQNWTYGKDYCVGQLTENVFGREQEILKGLKDNLDSLGIHPTRFEAYSMNLKTANVFEKVVYEIQTDFDISKVQSEISNFNNQSEFLVKIKVPGLMQDSWVTKEVNAKEFVSDIWAEQVSSDLGIFTVIRLISSGNIGLYEILPTLLHTSAKNIKRFPVKRLAYLKANDDAEIDLFADTCEVCGKQIEKNVFDEPVSVTRCARHMDYNTNLVKLGKEVDEEADLEADKIQAQEGLYLDNEGNVFDEEMLGEA